MLIGLCPEVVLKWVLYRLLSRDSGRTNRILRYCRKCCAQHEHCIMIHRIGLETRNLYGADERTYRVWRMLQIVERVMHNNPKYVLNNKCHNQMTVNSVSKATKTPKIRKRKRFSCALHLGNSVYNINIL